MSTWGFVVGLVGGSVGGPLGGLLRGPTGVHWGSLGVSIISLIQY